MIRFACRLSDSPSSYLEERVNRNSRSAPHRGKKGSERSSIDRNVHPRWLSKNNFSIRLRFVRSGIGLEREVEVFPTPDPGPTPHEGMEK